MKRCLAALMLVLLPVVAHAQIYLQWHACNTTTVTTGGTAVTAIVGPFNGYYIVNPLTTTDEGIATVEPLYVDPTTTATTTANVTNSALPAGSPFYASAPGIGPISVNAATSGHKFTCVRW